MSDDTIPTQPTDSAVTGEPGESAGALPSPPPTPQRASSEAPSALDATSKSTYSLAVSSPLRNEIVPHTSHTPARDDDLTDAEILTLTQHIKDEAAQERPLIAPLAPLSSLIAEYENGNPRILNKLHWLVRHGWTGLRRSRGDGDCFYRSVAYAYVERLMRARDSGEVESIVGVLGKLEETLGLLEAVGFQPLVYEDFYEVLRDMIVNLVEPDSHGNLLTPVTLLKMFQDPTTSNSVVVFLRLLTSAHIRTNADDFVPFLLHQETGEMLDVREFCEGQVEATSCEADHPQVLALSRALGISIEVAYVDGSTSQGEGEDDVGRVDFVKFEPDDGEGTPITLLYRPGHYDLLKRKRAEPAK